MYSSDFRGISIRKGIIVHGAYVSIFSRTPLNYPFKVKVKDTQ